MSHMSCFLEMLVWPKSRETGCRRIIPLSMRGVIDRRRLRSIWVQSRLSQHLWGTALGNETYNIGHTTNTAQTGILDWPVKAFSHGSGSHYPVVTLRLKMCFTLGIQFRFQALVWLSLNLTHCPIACLCQKQPRQWQNCSAKWHSDSQTLFEWGILHIILNAVKSSFKGIWWKELFFLQQEPGVWPKENVPREQAYIYPIYPTSESSAFPQDVTLQIACLAEASLGFYANKES